MTAADPDLTTSQEMRGGCLGLGSGDCEAVETRFQFHGYAGEDGSCEARDAEGQALIAADLRQILAAVPCFTSETLVATGQGLCAVGSLTPGARVITRDSGLQELRWIGRKRFGWRGLGLNPLLRPVRIAAGALGGGVPERDMVVSPNHRFLTRLPGEGESGERLTMARDLIGLDGVRPENCTGVEYWQLLFARHELVLADGGWSESFQPTAASLAAIGVGRLSDLPASLSDDSDFATVRPFVEANPAA